MKSLINYFNNIETSFSRLKFITSITVFASTIVAVSAMTFVVWSMNASRQKVYVVDRGSAVMAALSPEYESKDLEVKDHVTRFHELLFNVTPNAESIKRNVDRALTMCDRSAYDYWMDLSEKGFYQRVISANITQEIVVDSVSVDVSGYPYEAIVHASLYIIRESNITRYDFESSCRLMEVERSASNPHGLMMEKFAVIRNKKMETRRRN